MDDPIVFCPTEDDETHLAILGAAGLSRQDAVRVALTSLAADMTPVVAALSATATPTAA